MTKPQITVQEGRSVSGLPWTVREDGAIIARFRARQDALAFAALARELIADARPVWHDPTDED